MAVTDCRSPGTCRDRGQSHLLWFPTRAIARTTRLARVAARTVAEGLHRELAELESRLRLTGSELATTRAALATATDNVRTLQQAHDDAMLRLRGLEPGSRAP